MNRDLFLITMLLVASMLSLAVHATESTNASNYYFYDDYESGVITDKYTTDTGKYNISANPVGTGNVLKQNGTGNLYLDIKSNYINTSITNATCWDFMFFNANVTAVNSEMDGIGYNNGGFANEEYLFPSGYLNSGGSGFWTVGRNDGSWTNRGTRTNYNWTYFKSCTGQGYAAAGNTYIEVYTGSSSTNNTLLFNYTQIARAGLGNFRFATIGRATIQTYYDNVRIWNRDQYGINPPEQNTTGVTSVTFWTVTPPTITSTNLLTQHLNVTYQFIPSNVTKTYLNYSVTDAVLSCTIAVNGTCIKANNTYHRAELSSNFTNGTAYQGSYMIDENDIYLGSYNINDTTMASTTHANLALTSTNSYVSTEIYNVSNATPYNLFEFDATNNVSGTAQLFACNSTYSYASGSNVAIDPSCTNFGNFNTTAFNHTDNASAHNFVTIPLVNGRINSVFVTPTMTFLIRGTAATGGVNVGYVNLATRGSTTKTTVNNGNTWTNQTYTIDAHIHQMSYIAQLQYNACGNFSGTMLCSSNTQMALSPTGLPPSPPAIIRPSLNENITRFLNVTYLNATPSLNTSTIAFYNLSLLNSDQTFNQTIITNNGLNNTYILDTYPLNLSTGQYRVRVETTDSNAFKSSAISELFNIVANAELNITAVDGITASKVSNFSITLTNGSTSQTVIATNNVSSFSIVKGINYTMNIDANGYALTNTSGVFTDTNNAYQFNLSPTNSVYVSVFDQVSNQLITTLNTTVTFQSGPFYYNQTKSTGLFVFQNLTAGSWTVTVSAPGYATSIYFVQIADRTTQSLNAFLVQQTVNVIFTNKDAVTGSVISGGTFTVQNKVGPNYVTVGQTTTDAFGQAVFQLQPLHEYQFIIAAPGYFTKTGIVNTVITSYVVLVNPNNTQSFVSYTDDFTYKLTPDQVSANSTTFSLTTSSPQGALQWFAVVVTYNGTTYQQNVSGSPSGGTASVTIDFTNITGTSTVSAAYYAKSIHISTPMVLSRSWYLYGGFGKTNYTFVNFMEYYGGPSSPINMTTRGIMVTLAAVVLAAGTGLFLGAAAAMVVAATVFIIAGAFGWLGVGVTIITAGGLIGLLLLGGRS